MLRIFLLLCTALICALISNAQDTTKTEKKSTTTISAYADVYYRYDMTGKARTNNLTSFTNSHNSFELGMIELKVEHTILNKVGFVADLGFGKRATEFSYNEIGILAAIKQAYIFYQPKPWVKFTVGSWATHFRYEVVDPQYNMNYSMSYSFTYGPFFHTGLKTEFFKGNHSFMVGVTNPTDYKGLPPTGLNNKYVIAQYGLKLRDNFTTYFNYNGGKSTDTLMVNELDVVVAYNPSKKVTMYLNGTYNTMSTKFRETSVTAAPSNWISIALYTKYDIKNWVSICFRGEYFDDQDQLKAFKGLPTGGNILSATLGAQFKVHNLTLIPEFRFDNSSVDVFTDKSGSPVPYNASFLVAAYYTFSFTK